MVNRITFINSVSGINYPEMIVDFFDHFIALKQLVEDSGSVNVLKSENNSISFQVNFISKEYKDQMINLVNSLGGSIIIYGRPIGISLINISDISVQVNLI